MIYPQERLREIVKKAVDQADPIALLEIGCPDDEYDPEIRRILDYVMDCSDTNSLSERIYQTFVQMFDQGIAGPSETYQPIAQAIFAEMKTLGLEPGD